MRHPLLAVSSIRSRFPTSSLLCALVTLTSLVAFQTGCIVFGECGLKQSLYCNGDDCVCGDPCFEGGCFGDGVCVPYAGSGDAGVCVPRAFADENDIETVACESESDCLAGVCCEQNGARRCTLDFRDCDTTAPCSGSDCPVVGPGCEDACGLGEQCFEGACLCLPGGCSDGKTCDPSTSRCIDDDSELDSCFTSADCGEGRYCLSVGAERQCMACSIGEPCVEMVCAENPEDFLCLFDCLADADCGGGFCKQDGARNECVECLQDVDCPDGRCVDDGGGLRCVADCASADGCEEGREFGATCNEDIECISEQCLPWTNTCSSTCTTNAECGEGHSCASFPLPQTTATSNSCAPICESGFECGDGSCEFRFDTLELEIDRVCLDPSDRAPIGAECADDTECESGYCVDVFLPIGPGCAVDADCGDRAVCVCPPDSPQCSAKECALKLPICSHLCTDDSHCTERGHGLSYCRQIHPVVLSDGSEIQLPMCSPY